MPERVSMHCLPQLSAYRTFSFTTPETGIRAGALESESSAVRRAAMRGDLQPKLYTSEPGVRRNEEPNRKQYHAGRLVSHGISGTRAPWHIGHLRYVEDDR